MYLYGASGHGKVVKDIVEACGKGVDGFIDDNCEIVSVQGLPVRHSSEQIDELIISVGDNATRKIIANSLSCPISDAMVHPKAVVSPSVKIGKGTVVMAGVIINVDTTIGQHCIINTGATIDHESHIADFVHISPHVTLCGNITVGEGAWIGAGTVVIPGVHIGRWSIVGAGSVVLEDVPEGTLVYGNPSRFVKLVNQNQLEG